MREIPRHLPAAEISAFRNGNGLSAGAVLDPAVMAGLPPSVVDAFRAAIAAALHPVFVATLPFVALAIGAVLLMPEIPLRKSVKPSFEEAGKDLLAEMNQAGEADAQPVG